MRKTILACKTIHKLIGKFPAQLWTLHSARTCPWCAGQCGAVGCTRGARCGGHARRRSASPGEARCAVAARACRVPVPVYGIYVPSISSMRR